jgi:hypothetical protein
MADTDADVLVCDLKAEPVSPRDNVTIFEGDTDILNNRDPRILTEFERFSTYLYEFIQPQLDGFRWDVQEDEADDIVFTLSGAIFRQHLLCFQPGTLVQQISYLAASQLAHFQVDVTIDDHFTCQASFDVNANTLTFDDASDAWCMAGVQYIAKFLSSFCKPKHTATYDDRKLVLYDGYDATIDGGENYWSDGKKPAVVNIRAFEGQALRVLHVHAGAVDAECTSQCVILHMAPRWTHQQFAMNAVKEDHLIFTDPTRWEKEHYYRVLNTNTSPRMTLAKLAAAIVRDLPALDEIPEFNGYDRRVAYEHLTVSPPDEKAGIGLDTWQVMWPVKGVAAEIPRDIAHKLKPGKERMQLQAVYFHPFDRQVSLLTSDGFFTLCLGFQHIHWNCRGIYPDAAMAYYDSIHDPKYIQLLQTHFQFTGYEFRQELVGRRAYVCIRLHNARLNVDIKGVDVPAPAPAVVTFFVQLSVMRVALRHNQAGPAVSEFIIAYNRNVTDLTPDAISVEHYVAADSIA